MISRSEKQVALFEVEGQPRGKGRPRFRSINGRAIAYTDSETKAYEDRVREAYLNAGGQTYFCPMSIKITAHYEIPASYTKKQKEAAAALDIVPHSKPDVDNIAKIILDGLNKVAYKDDSQVFSIQCDKFFTTGKPRVEVRIWAYEQT